MEQEVTTPAGVIDPTSASRFQSFVKDATVPASSAELMTQEEIDKQNEQNPALSMGEAAGFVVDNNWLHNSLPAIGVMGEKDPNFLATAELDKELGIEVMPQEMRDWVNKADNEAEYRFRANKANQRIEFEKRLANSGWGAMGAYVLADVFDPEEIALVTAATWGAGTLAKVVAAPAQIVSKGMDVVDTAKTAKRLSYLNALANRRTLSVAAEGAAIALPIELMRAQYTPDYGLDDALLSTLAITGGVTAFGTWERANARAQMAVLLNRRKNMVGVDGKPIPLTKEELDIFSPVLSVKTIDNIAKNNFAEGTVRKGGKIKDADTGIDISNLSVYEDTPSQLGFNALSLFRKTLSVNARGSQSEIGLVRKVTNALSQNFAGYTDRSAVEGSALEIQAMRQQRIEARVLPEYQKLQKSWVTEFGGAKGNSKFGFSVQNLRDESNFNKEVSRHMRIGHSTDPRVINAANLYRKEIDELYSEAIEVNARGFTKESKQQNYLPRLYDDAYIDKFLQTEAKRLGSMELAREEFTNKFIRAIQGGQPDIDAEVAKRIGTGYAKGLLRRYTDSAMRSNTKAMHNVLEDDLDAVMEMLRAETKMTDEEAAVVESEIQRIYDNAQQGKTGIGRARHRLKMDEREIIDFLQDDVMDLVNNYSFQLGGSIGLAKHGIEVNGGASWDGIKQAILDYAQKTGVYNGKSGVLEKEMDGLDFLMETLKGTLNRGEPQEKIFRKLRDANFVRVMNMTGLTSMIELGSVLTDHSISTVVRSIPELKRLYKKGAAGDFDDEVIREMAHGTGVGMDVFTGRTRNHFDDHDGGFVAADYDKLDAILAQGRRITATASGMLGVTAYLRRLDGYLFAKDWFAAAAKGKSPYAKIKMEQLGFNPEDTKGILQQIKQHAKVDGNGKLIALNTNEWSDKALLEKFMLGARRHTLSSVQETSAGSVNRFMRSSTGKTIFQFMSYPLAAGEQQTQRLTARFMHGDATKVTQIIMANALMASMVYYTAVHTRSLGMSEEKRKKYLESSLDPATFIASGTIGYMGVSGVVPALLGQLDGGKFLTPPAADALQIVSSAYRRAKGEVTGGSGFTEAGVREATRLLPFQNWYFFNWLLNSIAAQAK
jgi:hypothetical protein